MRSFASSGAAVMCVLAWIAGAEPARAEALPGIADVSAGGHVMMAFGDRCETDFDVQGCSSGTPYAGFQLDGSVQVVPWFALGLHAAGSSEIDSSVAVSGGVTSPRPAFSQTRDLWFWRGTLRLRFDPPLWPKALWLAAELGAVVAIDSLTETDLASGRERGTSESHVGFVAGLALGWDIPVYEGFWIGPFASGQLIALPELPPPPLATETIALPSFPYVELGLRLGYRF